MAGAIAEDCRGTAFAEAFYCAGSRTGRHDLLPQVWLSSRKLTRIGAIILARWFRARAAHGWRSRCGSYLDQKLVVAGIV